MINNVETMANIPSIINEGADWYAAIGTEKSKGTKTFALVGKIKRTGLVEVPLGITLREMVFEIGGGVLNDKFVEHAKKTAEVLNEVKGELTDWAQDGMKAVGTPLGNGGKKAA